MQLNFGASPQPQPHDPAPPEPTGPPPNPKRTVLGVLGSIVASVALGGAITGVILFLSADMRDTTHRFLDHLRADRDDDAYEMLSDNLRTRVPESAFAAYIEQNAPGIRRTGGEWINGFSGGGDRQCMEVWVDDGRTLYLLLQKERGAWRIDEVTEVERDECDSD